jgi:hypothetical protein
MGHALPTARKRVRALRLVRQQRARRRAVTQAERHACRSCCVPLPLLLACRCLVRHVAP